jgi:hypothetical protein
MATVLVPWRGGDSHRERAWHWVADRWFDLQRDLDVRVCWHTDGPWNKGAAIAAHVADSRGVVVLADADCWCDGVHAAIDAVEAGADWAVPHKTVHRLTERGTAAVLAGAPWEEQRLEKRPYTGFEGGGILVASRSVLEAVPLDTRFVGWGQEDECHAMALRTFFGRPWRGTDPLVHLWHPPQERLSRRRGSEASWALRQRYFAARNDPGAMKALIEETHVSSPAH